MSPLKIISLVLVLAILVFCAVFYWRVTDREPVKIGILHSLSGTMAVSEKPVVDAITLAVEEINESGGVLGRPILPVLRDGRSDAAAFAAEARSLILQEQVSTIFGCWTSASRKTVKEIVEELNHLLVYPLQYEGLEMSPNIIYMGAAPNQQIIPAVKWSLDNLGKKFFLVGSDYVFPRTANAIIRDQVVSLGGQIVGEEYVLLGSREVTGIVTKIQNAQPDVILNTINGDSNVPFFQALRKAGIHSKDIPTMSFSIGENELALFQQGEIESDYAAWNYFQTVESDENRKWVERFKKRFGDKRVTGDPLEAAYASVYLWAQAVEDAETTDVTMIRNAFKDQSANMPEGIVYIDSETSHAWKIVRIGRIKEGGQFEIVWSSEKPVRPQPFPIFRTRAEWEAFLQNLHSSWGNSWVNPGTSQISATTISEP